MNPSQLDRIVRSEQTFCDTESRCDTGSADELEVDPIQDESSVVVANDVFVEHDSATGVTGLVRAVERGFETHRILWMPTTDMPLRPRSTVFGNSIVYRASDLLDKVSDRRGEDTLEHRPGLLHQLCQARIYG